MSLIIKSVDYSKSPNKCQLCEKTTEADGSPIDLRPYGPGGAWICFECGMKDEAGTSRRMNGIMFGDDIAGGNIKHDEL